MSCVICQESNINLYKCSVCVATLCGNCLFSWNKNCPNCRSEPDFSDPNCPKIKAVKSLTTKKYKNGEIFEKVKISSGVEVWIEYDGKNDKWIMKSTQQITTKDDEDVPLLYVRASGYGHIEGITDPDLKHIDITYVGQRSNTTYIQKDNYNEVHRSIPILKVTGYNLSCLEEEWKNNISDTVYSCDHCYKNYKGTKTLKNHLDKIHKL